MGKEGKKIDELSKEDQETLKIVVDGFVDQIESFFSWVCGLGEDLKDPSSSIINSYGLEEDPKEEALHFTTSRSNNLKEHTQHLINDYIWKFHDEQREVKNILKIAYRKREKLLARVDKQLEKLNLFFDKIMEDFNTDLYAEQIRNMFREEVFDSMKETFDNESDAEDCFDAFMEVMS